MMDLVSLIRQVVQAEMQTAPQSALGVIAALHLPDAAGLNQYACDVTLQGSDVTYEKVPLCTAYLGQLAPPVTGDVVVLHFIGGDPDAPLITGCVFSETVTPPEMAEGEFLLRLPHDAAPADQIETRQTAGANGSRQYHVKLTEGGAELVLTDQSLTATMGDHVLTLDADGGTARLTSGGATLTLEGSNATLQTDGDIGINATGNLTLEAGGNAEITAGGTMALKASKIDLN